MGELTARQRLFVAEYLKDLNGAQAAIRAGYSTHSANTHITRIMASPGVRAAIDAALSARDKRLAVDADYVLARLVAEHEADLAELYDEQGQLRPISEWPLIWRQGLVVSVESTELFEGLGKARTQIGVVRKVRLAPRRTELLGKHIGVNAFREQVEVSGADGLAERVARAKQRAAG